MVYLVSPGRAVSFHLFVCVCVCARLRAYVFELHVTAPSCLVAEALLFSSLSALLSLLKHIKLHWNRLLVKLIFFASDVTWIIPSKMHINCHFVAYCMTLLF